jgi:hypothetical protein
LTNAFRSRRILPLWLILVAACAPTSGNKISNDVVVLPGSEVVQLLSQCSRGAPAPGEASWQPATKDIADFETALPAALSAHHVAGDPDWSRVLLDWRRQYVGIVRGGHRFIYGNFFPRGMTEEAPYWLNKPVGVCDGGHAFFGAEFDIQTRRFTQIDFNGVA